jgi:hypothetical protein
MQITKIRIHPCIGIARVGNSPSEFFVGPELVGDHTPPEGGYKDSRHRVKRQAVRFRLYGYDENDALVKEITAADAAIEWTVHVANKKAEWVQFQGPEAKTDKSLKRNPKVKDRDSLIIDPGPRSLHGVKKTALFETGKFLSKTVPLGEMRTDQHSRLLVLGGFGKSDSPNNARIKHWANNDGWHDDISDGPVLARVELNGRQAPIEAVPAWVICAPPKFAPPLTSIITMYDTLLQKAIENGWLSEPPNPSFTNDIYPILIRAVDMKWVSAMAAPHHSTLSDVIPPPGTGPARQAIFERLRDPSIPLDQTSDGDMPMIWSDIYNSAGHDSSQPLTKIQYNMMRKWKDGSFTNDWAGPPVPTTEITPQGLDRAALEACVGGAFYPGIEASWMVRDTYTFSEPFRLDHSSLGPGDVTKQMAVPWQTDFYDCSIDGELAWWPAVRPDDVFPVGRRKQVKWTRNLVRSGNQMIARWHKLGFVVQEAENYVEKRN